MFTNSHKPRFIFFIALLLMVMIQPMLHAQTATIDKQWLESRFSGISVKRVDDTPIQDLKQVVLNNDQIVYISSNGELLLSGAMMNLKTGQNMTESIETELRKEKLLSSTPNQLFEFPAQDEKHKITVVTDIDCTYCRRLHTEIPELNSKGISVQYVMLPRSGLNTSSHHKAVWAACAADPEATLTSAMNGQVPPEKQCDNTIQQQFELARDLRLSGTPAIIFDDGRMIKSYLTPAQITQQLAEQR